MDQDDYWPEMKTLKIDWDFDLKYSDDHAIVTLIVDPAQDRRNARPYIYQDGIGGPVGSQDRVLIYPVKQPAAFPPEIAGEWQWRLPLVDGTRYVLHYFALAGRWERNDAWVWKVRDGRLERPPTLQEVEATWPDLEGTPKQVAWATDIRRAELRSLHTEKALQLAQARTDALYWILTYLRHNSRTLEKTERAKKELKQYEANRASKAG